MHMKTKRPRIPGNLCAFTYKADGETKVQLIHHNITCPRIQRDIEEFRREQRQKKRERITLL